MSTATYPRLTYIPLGDLIAAAGDPWQIDATLQSGDAGQISELATAFRTAGTCATETSQEFYRARERFEASWHRESGEHPINDGREVQRATKTLMVSSEHLPEIAVDLQTIAADLAETQRISSHHIDQLNAQLHALDAQAGHALAQHQDTSAIAQQAVDDTKTTYGAEDIFRQSYGNKLQATLTDLRLRQGYDPAAIEDVDGDADPGPRERAESGAAHYGDAQRAKDEALVHDGGPMTPEKADAAGRLADYAVANDPAAAPEARELAGERLDDFRMANFTGPLPTDPVLGGDARTRAQNRLDMQRQLQQGFRGLPPMTRDQATQALDEGEQFGRVVAVKQAYFALTGAGMSADGARNVLEGFISSGGLAATGAETHANKIPRGSHALPSTLSAHDADVVAKWAGRTGNAGDLLELGMAFNDRLHGGSNEDLGSALGGWAAGSAAAWGTAIAAGSFTGPWTTAALTIAAAYFVGKAGEAAGGAVGRNFDPVPAHGG